MLTVPYTSAITKAVQLAPSVSRPTEFIRWAEDICELITYIYSKEYATVTQDLVDAAKESEDIEDNEE